MVYVFVLNNPRAVQTLNCVITHLLICPIYSQYISKFVSLPYSILFIIIHIIFTLFSFYFNFLLLQFLLLFDSISVFKFIIIIHDTFICLIKIMYPSCFNFLPAVHFVLASAFVITVSGTQVGLNLMRSCLTLVSLQLYPCIWSLPKNSKNIIFFACRLDLI